MQLAVAVYMVQQPYLSGRIALSSAQIISAVRYVHHTHFVQQNEMKRHHAPGIRYATTENFLPFFADADERTAFFTVRGRCH